MSQAHRPPASVTSPGGRPVPRIREQARDALAVMVLSALTSLLLAGGLLVLVSVGG